MRDQYLFDFKTEISDIEIPEQLNNPFGTDIPTIAKVATIEFRAFISEASQNWDYDFEKQRGKMFGVLVVQRQDGSLAYLGTVSGKFADTVKCKEMVPSVFEVSMGDYFINSGMTELTEIGKLIQSMTDALEIETAKEDRRQKSIALQRRLFEHYRFLNNSGIEKNIIEIFEEGKHGYPPAAAGECAAPKLLQFALAHQLKPIAIAEFWWGSPKEQKQSGVDVFYPACKDRCRPILEWMLMDESLFEQNSIS
jgi:tRNA pseudouridine32 synthase/23S rRNA pseudouridine746 synthase